MHDTVNKIISIEKEIQEKITREKLPNSKLNIVAISKTFSISKILPLINHGHDHFGENKVQEALEKWIDIKNDFKNIKLHMVGKLQTNKVKHAVTIFDYIHSLDNLKLAEKISTEQIKKNKKLKIFIQINIGNESQKSGILPENLENFYKICNNDLNLNIIGLMCIPPFEKDSKPYFIKMKELCKNLDLKDISMGMSDDYMEAIKQGSTFIRIGSKIFGARS